MTIRKNRALSTWGMSDASAAGRTCMNFFLTGMIGYGATGDKFEDLVNIITNTTMQQKGLDQIQYNDVRKKVKKILYSGKDPEGFLQGVNIRIPYVGRQIAK